MKFCGRRATAFDRFGILRFGFLLRLPEDGRQADEQREIGDIVDQRVGHHVRARASTLSAQDRKDEVSDAGTIRHNERAQHGAVEAAIAHGL